MKQDDASVMEPAGYRVAAHKPKFLSRSEELAMLEKAQARDPGNRLLLEQLSQAYFAHDMFDETIACCERLCADGEQAEVLHTWGLCLLARENEADTLAAIAVLRRSVAGAQSARTASFALSAIGKAYLRLERMDEARAALVYAIDRYPNNKDAFKRLTMSDFLANRPEDALALAERLMASGTPHARTFAIQTMALARLGRIEEARTAFGLDEFLSVSELPVPEGWADLASFNRDVAQELVSHPGFHFERYGAASTQTWRVDDPVLARCKAVRALVDAISRAVERHVDTLPPSSHLWPSARADGAQVFPWSVITYGSGYEEWHVHQNGWISGSYYVEVPEGIRNGSDKGGCIGFGLPENLVGQAAHDAFGMQLHRPQPGMLMLFPSHCFHRTFPYEGAERRICLAFDIATPPVISGAT